MKAKELKLLPINLQLFADGEEIDPMNDYANADIELLDTSDDEEEEADLESLSDDGEGQENELLDEEIQENDVEGQDQKPKHQLSKQDKAIIKAKREAKELKEKLAEFERKEQEKLLQEKKSNLKASYLEKGYEEDMAHELAEKTIQNEKLEARLDRIEYTEQAKQLQNRYPDVMNKLPELIKLCKQLDWPLEKVCRAELDESPGYDVKTKAEQMALIRSKNAQSKKVDTADAQPISQPTQLTPQQNRLFQMWSQSPFGKGKSKKEFLETLNSEW